MGQIYQSLQALITPECAEKIARRLHVRQASLSLAISTVFAGFLQFTKSNGDTRQLRKLFDQAGSLRILSNMESSCLEKFTPATISVGDEFLQHVLGDSASGFTNRVSVLTGYSHVATNTLIAILAPVYVAYIGDKMISNQWSMRKLFGMLKNRKSSHPDFAIVPL